MLLGRSTFCQIQPVSDIIRILLAKFLCRVRLLLQQLLYARVHILTEHFLAKQETHKGTVRVYADIFPNLLQPLADMKYHVSGICELDFQTFGHNTPKLTFIKGSHL